MFNILTTLQTTIKEKIKIMAISVTIKGRFLTRYIEITVIFFSSCYNVTMLYLQILKQ